MPNKLQEQLNQQLRKELEGSCIKAALASIVLAAIYQFVVQQHIPNTKFHLTAFLLLSLSMIARVLLCSIKSLNNNAWLNLHKLVLLSNSVFWAALLSNVAFSETTAVEAHLITTLLLVGLVAAAAFSIAISKLDFYLFVTPIIFTQIAVTYLSDYSDSFRVAGNLIALLFFGFLGLQRHRIEQNWRNVRIQNYELQQIIDAVPGGISVLRDGKYIIVNRYIQEILPTTLPIVGQQFGSILGQHHPYAQKIIDFVKSDLKKTQFESVLPVNGVNRTHLITASKTENEIIVSSTDTEDLKKVQQTLIHSAKMASLGEMSSGLSHEINNPVAIISLRAQQMGLSIKKEAATPESLLKGLETIQTATERIARIAKGLRSFSQNNSELEIAPVLVKSVVDDALTFCEKKFKNSNVILGVEIPPDLEIKCDSGQISQVILNALNNSFEAITTREEKWIHIRAIQDGNTVTLSISDSGLGVAPEIRDKVMQPFYSTKEVGKGTGLGLSVAKGIIESHKGELYFNFSENKPTELRIVLPAMPKEAA